MVIVTQMVGRRRERRPAAEVAAYGVGEANDYSQQHLGKRTETYCTAVWCLHLDLVATKVAGDPVASIRQLANVCA